MIQINEITSVPEDALNDLIEFSAWEWETTGKIGQMLLDMSEFMVCICDEMNKPLMILGVVRSNMCARRPELWALLCNNLLAQPHQWRYLKRGFQQVLQPRYPRMSVPVGKDNEKSQRFIKFFGFKQVQEHDNMLVLEID